MESASPGGSVLFLCGISVVRMNDKELEEKRIALLGMGVENRSVGRFLAERGIAFSVCDARTEEELPGAGSGGTSPGAGTLAPTTWTGWTSSTSSSAPRESAP